MAIEMMHARRQPAVEPIEMVHGCGCPVFNRPGALTVGDHGTDYTWTTARAIMSLNTPRLGLS